MKLFTGFSPLKDVSITKKLYFIVGTMAMLIALELLTLWFAIHTLSSVRALVGAEGLWSKAQKDATYQLEKYYRTHNDSDYEAMQKFMEVPMGDHKTRLELLKPNPDLSIAREGFLEGRVHPDDIDGMIKLLIRFHSNRYLHNAIQAWTKGDSLIADLMPISNQMHAEINSQHPSAEKLDLLISELDPINQHLTALEDNFSFTLGEGSRWMEGVVLKLLFGVALTVEITGLMLSISVTRALSKGLTEINKTTRKIVKGDLTARAKVFSKDEIGQVATAMNQMTEQLIFSNNELAQFAYVTSHDLQEPLRTISNYSGLFEEEFKGKLGTEADKFLLTIRRATTRMQLLIKSILDYSIIGSNKQLSDIDCNKVMDELMTEMSVLIANSKAEISFRGLPVIHGTGEIKSLFQNLVSNAIKFGRKDVAPVITIMSRDDGGEWLFAVADNGIGIEEKYQGRIFTIFQRLHLQSDYEGTGIGLAHCKKIVELHGGKIWVTSVFGLGSTFYFTIPKTLL